MARNDKLKLCEEFLFEDKDKLTHLPDDDVAAIIRIRRAYVYMRDFPTKRDKEVRDFLMTEFGIQKSTAYDDIKIAQILCGQFNKASKDWIRFKFNAWCEETRELARKTKNAMAMARVDANYAKFNGLDVEETEPIDWDKIYIQPFFPTDDPTTIGIKPIPNLQAKIDSLKKKYFADIEAVDVDYSDITFNSDDLFKEANSDGIE